MNADKLRELRYLIGRAEWSSAGLKVLDEAIALIDAELAKQEDVCVWDGDYIEKDCGGDSSWCIDGDPPDYCPDCGKRVEVRP